MANYKRGKEHHNYQHGRSRTPIHNIWSWMKARCNNPNATSYPIYGAKGIKVCKRWYKFSNFLEDMGDTYFPGASIDRIDNKKGYSPANCRWVTKEEQAKNKSSVTQYCVRGECGIIRELVSVFGVPETAVRYRLRSGWDIEDAFTLPTNSAGKYEYKNKS